MEKEREFQSIFVDHDRLMRENNELQQKLVNADKEILIHINE